MSSAPPSLLFSLERGPCFGACPVYRVEAFTDGLLRFKGERHVKVTEAVETKLTQAQLAAIITRVATLDFKWADYTQRDTTDHPTVVLTLGTRTLKHDHGDQRAPEGLKRLEDDLDTLVGTQQWISGTGGPTQ